MSPDSAKPAVLQVQSRPSQSMGFNVLLSRSGTEMPSDFYLSTLCGQRDRRGSETGKGAEGALLTLGGAPGESDRKHHGPNVTELMSFTGRGKRPWAQTTYKRGVSYSSSPGCRCRSPGRSQGRCWFLFPPRSQVLLRTVETRKLGGELEFSATTAPSRRPSADVVRKTRT